MIFKRKKELDAEDFKAFPNVGKLEIALMESFNCTVAICEYLDKMQEELNNKQNIVKRLLS